ncbi:MAG TPA: FG-GAP-like repeat-containing protein, partial [Ignavibacteria bacterium]|nr:FG-GAP-like repeat-containing protein [Ignavibacteria bacterium]
MKNEITKSGIGNSSSKNYNAVILNVKTVKAVMIFVFTIFACGLFAQPVVTSFSPLSGPVGTMVTISGSGFNTSLANNIVFFGAAIGTVSFSSATSLTVSVPAGANYQYISVTNLDVNLTGYSLKPFLFTFPGGCKPPVFETGVAFTAGTQPYSVNICDIDGDGKSDLAVANLGSNTVSVFRNISTSGGVSFAPNVDFATGGNPISVSYGDLDGDGKPDLAIANSGSNTVSVLKNTSPSGTVSFAAKVDFTTGLLPQGVSIGDIDMDGKPDMVVVNQAGNSTSVFRNTSTGGVINSGSFAAKVDFASGSGPKSVSIGDIDGDGKPDVVVANSVNADVAVLRNTSVSGVINSGSFAASVYFSTFNGTVGYNPWSVCIGDIDGDGKPELVVANFFENVNMVSSVSLFQNISTSGNVNFASSIYFYPGSKASSVKLG